MLHHPRPQSPASFAVDAHDPLQRPPTRSERLLRDTLLRDDSIRCTSSSSLASMPSPPRQRSHTTPKPSPSRTCTPTSPFRSSTSPALKQRPLYHAGDDEFSSLSGSPPSPTRLTFRRSSKSEGNVPRRSLGIGMGLEDGGGRASSGGRISPTPHEMVLRTRLENVLSNARRMDTSCRAHSPSPTRHRSHLRRDSSSAVYVAGTDRPSNSRHPSLPPSKRSSTSSNANHTRSSDSVSSSDSEQREGEDVLLTPPPTPPETFLHQRSHARDSSPVAAYNRSNSDSAYAISSRSASHAPRSPPPKLLHSVTSPPGHLPMEGHSYPYIPHSSPRHLTPPPSSSPSPDTDSPPTMGQSTSSTSLSSLVPRTPSSPSSPRLNSPSSPSFNVRKASAHCRAMEGYVSFAAVEGLGSPSDGLDDQDEQEGNAVPSDGRRGWIGGLLRRG